MKEVDSRLAAVQLTAVVALGAVLVMLLVLGACLPPEPGQNATPTGKSQTVSGASPGASAPSPGPSPPGGPIVVSGKTPVNASALNLTQNKLVNLTVQPCAITAQVVGEACGFGTLPTAAGCVFDSGPVLGAISIERYNTTRDGYALVWSSVPGTTILSDREPFEAMNEYQNIKYVWRFQGSTLVVVRATRSTCKLDNLRLLASMAMGGQ